MSESSHLELQGTDSEALGHLDSVSLPSEPPDIRNWFSGYVYESPRLDALDGFQDSDGERETCLEEDNNGESGNNDHRVGEYDDSCAAVVKSSQRIELESLEFTADSEPPDIRNWFSSYTYESPSPPLDTANDFLISDHKEGEDGNFYVGGKSGNQTKKDLMASIDVGKPEFTQMNASGAVVKGPDMVRDTVLDYQSVCKDHDEDDDVTLQPLSSILSLSSSDEVSEPMLSGQRAGYKNHKSPEKIGSTNAYGNDCDGPLSFRSSISLNMENNIGSQDGKSIYRSIEGTDRVTDGLKNKRSHETVSPQTTDKIASTGDSCGKENEETELLEDGFISVRKRSRQENAVVNVIKPLMDHKKDGNIVRKVLSEISNFATQNREERTGKWSCPQKNKPDLGPPLKQLRLDQWVRRV